MAGRWTLYILVCGDGSLYTGITTDLAARLAAHRRGRGAKYTRAHAPVSLAWCKKRMDGTAARRLEWALRRRTRAEKLSLIAGDERLWRRLRRAIGRPAGRNARTGTARRSRARTSRTGC